LSIIEASGVNMQDSPALDFNVSRTAGWMGMNGTWAEAAELPDELIVSSRLLMREAFHCLPLRNLKQVDVERRFAWGCGE
jgi:hypothetical protein